MLACAGPSRPHTCVSGSPGRGGWGGQRSPLWATATGPGLFRSLGFKNPSGYWLFGGQHTAIQRVGRLGGAKAPACVVCVFACADVPCAKFQHFSEGGRSSGSAPAFAVREVVRVPGSVVSHRSLRIPDGTSCPPVRVQVAARTAAGVCGSCVSLFGGWGKTDETSTRSGGTGGGAGCCRGGWFPRRRLESSTCREPKSTSSRVRTPALDD